MARAAGATPSICRVQKPGDPAISGSPPQRACIFCGDGANSREHVFPNWLNDLIVVDGADAHHFLMVGGELKEQRSYAARNVASQTAKVVCDECNNGWMSDLEGQTKPLIGPLIVNHEKTLVPAQQLVVARWVIKTAMVAESVQYGEHSFTEQERRLIRDGRTIPIRPRVSLAAYDMSEPNATRYTRGQGVITRDGDFVADFYVHTIQIGHLVASVRGTSTFDAATNISLGEVARPRFMEIPVWPPVDVCNWPPNHVMAEEEFIEYSGGHSLEPSTPGNGPLSFDPAKLMSDYQSPNS